MRRDGIPTARSFMSIVSNGLLLSVYAEYLPGIDGDVLPRVPLANPQRGRELV